jgi:hypothetical protein
VTARERVVLDEKTLNRTLLHRQLLLERADLSIEAAVEQVGGLQTQYAPSGYVGLWTRLRRFERDELTRALEDRTVVQGTLMRTTIHLVSRREYWLYAMGIRDARRTWSLRVQHRGGDSAELVEQAQGLRSALADGPRTVKELGELATGFVGNLGLWVDLVRVPPSGTWDRRRADRLALADEWVGPENATTEEGLVHLVRAYLKAFGPAPLPDAASWAGVPVTDLQRAAANLELGHFADARGRELVDLPELDIADADTPAPVRFLPHWDNTMLVHARRSGILPEAHRAVMFTTKNPFSVGAVLVDGRVAASWSLRDGEIAVTAYETIASTAREALEAERIALQAFHA